MTPHARLAAAIELVELFRTGDRPADGLASHYFKTRRFIGSGDRADVSRKFYGVLRHWARLRWHLKDVQAKINGRSMLIAYGALIDTKASPPYVNLFDGRPYHPETLRTEENMLIRALDGRTLEPEEMPEADRLECPYWAEDGLRAVLGDDFALELEAMRLSASLDLRVNPLKTDRDTMLKHLHAEGFTAAIPTPFSPYGIRLPERVALGALPALKEGTLEIQDEGSQLAALVVDAKPSHAVLDLCAGAGGKSLLLANAMANKGQLVLSDIDSVRLNAAKLRLRRAGVHNYRIHESSGETDRWFASQKGRFDRVLVDAPCSGCGTWRRNPDGRWRNPAGSKRTNGSIEGQEAGGLAVLSETQAGLLDASLKLVKVGGRLVYATCSLLPQENAEQLERLMAAQPAGSLTPISAWDILTEQGITLEKVLGEVAPQNPQSPWLTLTPARHHTDGFFVGVLQKNA